MVVNAVFEDRKGRQTTVNSIVVGDNPTDEEIHAEVGSSPKDWEIVAIVEVRNG